MPDQTPARSSGLSGIQVRELYEDLRGSFTARNEGYRRARSRYAGEHWDPDTNPAVVDKYSLTLNYVRPTVDKTVRSILAETPGMQVVPAGVDELDRRHAEASEAILYYAWEKNKAPVVLRKVLHNQVLLSVGYVYYWWDSKKKCVRFRSIAPDNVLPVYDGEEMVQVILVSRRLTSALKRQYPGLASKIESSYETDQAFVTDDTTLSIGGSGHQGEQTETTVVLDWYDDQGHWVRVMGDAVHTQNLEYGTDHVPVIVFPNQLVGDERQPRNDIDDIVELNQYMDQLVSQQADVLRRYSTPTVIDEGSGHDPSVVKRLIQTFGGVLNVRKGANIKYLNYEGTAPDFQNQWARVMASLFDLSGHPASSYGQTLTNQSGVMTNLSLTPTVASTADKQAVFGEGLIALNEDILRLYEKFMAGETISLRGIKAGGVGRKTYEPFSTDDITGAEIAGWYKNRIKWPSVLRTDDPVYVQNIISQVTSKPPLMSVYDAMEALGTEDVEAAIDRIKAQLEDPRFSPEVLEAGINAATALQNSPQMPPGMEGMDPGMATSVDAESMNTASVAGGQPNRNELVSGTGGI